MSSLEKCLFMSSVHFSIGFFVLLLLLSCKDYLQIFGDEILVGCIICKDCLPFCGLSFFLLIFRFFFHYSLFKLLRRSRSLKGWFPGAPTLGVTLHPIFEICIQIFLNVYVTAYFKVIHYRFFYESRGKQFRGLGGINWYNHTIEHNTTGRPDG